MQLPVAVMLFILFFLNLCYHATCDIMKNVSANMMTITWLNVLSHGNPCFAKTTKSNALYQISNLQFCFKLFS